MGIALLVFLGVNLGYTVEKGRNKFSSKRPFTQDGVSVF